jgi:hypothetical protein
MQDTIVSSRPDTDTPMASQMSFTFTWLLAKDTFNRSTTGYLNLNLNLNKNKNNNNKAYSRYK